MWFALAFNNSMFKSNVILQNCWKHNLYLKLISKRYVITNHCLNTFICSRYI